MARDQVGSTTAVLSTTLAPVINVRRAGPSDLPELVRMYRLLEQEMLDLHAMWPVADGVDEPVEETLAVRLESREWFIFLGGIDEVPLGFVSSRLDALLIQGGDEQVGLIDLIFTEPEARDVGIAEAMLDAAIEALSEVGAERFDAPVLPGHRRAKNFFERSRFSARSITMHRRKR